MSFYQDCVSLAIRNKLFYVPKVALECFNAHTVVTLFSNTSLASSLEYFSSRHSILMLSGPEISSNNPLLDRLLRFLMNCEASW